MPIKGDIDFCVEALGQCHYEVHAFLRDDMMKDVEGP